MSKLSFKPAAITKRLIAELPERARDVVASRYGLGTASKSETLDSIGKRYGVTRERVRQIENHAVKLVQDSKALAKEVAAFKNLEESIREMGGVLSEETILSEFAKDDETRNHLYFLLVVGQPFTHAKESDDFKARWFVDRDMAKAVEDSLKQVHAKVRPSDVLSEDDLVEHVVTCLAKVSTKYKGTKDTIRRWLELSNCLLRNPLGEWGRSEAPGIRVKNIRDHAYLALKRHGSPMHFREVAKAIEKLFGKKAHEATTHNELIKDSRFVLVGRGIYALSEWGYRTGPVVEIIKHVLRESGPLGKEEIMRRVGKERYVKPNTIVVNLQNQAFVKTDGKYSLKSL